MAPAMSSWTGKNQEVDYGDQLVNREPATRREPCFLVVQLQVLCTGLPTDAMPSAKHSESKPVTRQHLVAPNCTPKPTEPRTSCADDTRMSLLQQQQTASDTAEVS